MVFFTTLANKVASNSLCTCHQTIVKKLGGWGAVCLVPLGRARVLWYEGSLPKPLFAKSLLSCKVMTLPSLVVLWIFQ